MIGLTSLWTNGRSPVSPELDPRRARFVLGRIDEILTWEMAKEKERDVRFVELGEHLCEVRSKQYWRLEKLRSFEEFLGKRVSGITPKGLLSDGDPRKSQTDSQASAPRGGMEHSGGTSQGSEEGWRKLRLCNLVAQSQRNAKGGI